MIDPRLHQTFQNGSTTYYYSSLFFPPEVKSDVFALYAFVRTADDFVDCVPAQEKEFHDFVKAYRQALGGKLSDDIRINLFVDLQNKYQFPQEWVDTFLRAMSDDLNHQPYQTLAPVEEYMYGSAEVIGLMMATILKLPKDAHSAAQKLGKAMQYINFLRDIKEDLDLGRQYIAQSLLQRNGVTEMTEPESEKEKKAFRKLMRCEIERYRKWNTEARKNFRFIPRRYRIPIKTASDMYDWTARKIEYDPLIVFRKKVKPSKFRVILTVVKNTLSPFT